MPRWCRRRSATEHDNEDAAPPAPGAHRCAADAGRFRARAAGAQQRHRAELESLDGIIGPALAARLLAARTQAPFKDWADLKRRVRGIGTAQARKLSAQGLRVPGLPYEEQAPG